MTHYSDVRVDGVEELMSHKAMGITVPNYDSSLLNALNRRFIDNANPPYKSGEGVCAASSQCDGVGKQLTSQICCTNVLMLFETLLHRVAGREYSQRLPVPMRAHVQFRI